MCRAGTSVVESFERALDLIRERLEEALRDLELPLQDADPTLFRRRSGHSPDFRDRLVASTDGDRPTLLDLLQIAREVGLRLVDVDLCHVAKVDQLYDHVETDGDMAAELGAGGEEGANVGDQRLIANTTDRRVCRPQMKMSGFSRRSQAVLAPTRANASDGVIHWRVCRGRPLSSAATASRCAAEWTERSVPLGNYCRSSPLVFSFEPRCHGLWGSQK